VRKPRRGAHLEDLDIDWRMIFKCLLSIRTGGMDLIDLAQGNTGGCLCEHGNEISHSIKCGEWGGVWTVLIWLKIGTRERLF
jgi:hypothetical protein